MRARIAFATALLCLLLLPRQALAQRVLLLRPPASDSTLLEAFNRLRAELLLQDFEVTVRDAGSEPATPELLEAQAQQVGAFAGISLTRKGRGATADVCIADRVTGKISQRRLVIADPRGAPRVIAVRAVDLLRESLRELPEGERPPPDVVGVQVEPAPPEVHAFAARPTRWQLRAAGVGLGPVSELPPAFGGGLALLYRPVPRLSLGVSAVGPLLGARFRARGGSASIRQELALLRGFWNMLGAGGWELGPLVAAGAYHLHAQGEVLSPLRARSDEVWSFVASGGVELELHLTRALSLGASLSCLFLTPQPVIAIDTSQQALNAPLLAASVGLGVAF